MGKENKEQVNHPDHYNPGPYEVIKVIEAWGCGFHSGNAIKYIARYKKKNNPIQDLKKAKWYIERLIELEQGKEGKSDETIS